MQLNERQEEWVKALESGDYEQGQEALLNDSGGLCCLGVACEVYPGGEWDADDHFVVEDDADDMNLPQSVADWFSIRTVDGRVDQSFMLKDGVLVPWKRDMTIDIGDQPMHQDSLVGFNDQLAATFAQIAQFVRDYPHLVFGDGS